MSFESCHAASCFKIKRHLNTHAGPVISGRLVTVPNSQIIQHTGFFLCDSETKGQLFQECIHSGARSVVTCLSCPPPPSLSHREIQIYIRLEAPRCSLVDSCIFNESGEI